MNSATPKEARRAVAQLTVLRILVYAILVFLSILCLFSFVMLFINASRSNGQLQAGFTLIPGGHMLENFRNAWTDSSINIPRGLLNSFIVAACTAVLTTYFSALTAYGFQDFKGKKFLFGFIMAIMVIPTQVSASGFVQICYKFGLTNNYWVLILPGIAAPIVFFYIKQYMESNLPMEIVDAARVDGCGEFRTFNFIILPMLKPALAVQLIFSFVQSWNNYFLPSLLLTKAVQVRHGQGVHVHPAGHPAGSRGVHHPLQVHHQRRHRRLREGMRKEQAYAERTGHQ